jgi:hypothetical protein
VSSTGRLRGYLRAAVLILPAVAVAAGAMTPAAAAPAGPVTAVAAQQAVTPADQFPGVSCPADRFCMGVGWYIPADGVKRPLAEAWDGSAWHITFPLMPSPAPASVLQTVSCTSRTACLAVGDTTTSGDHGIIFGKLFAEKWDGSTWRMVPIADPGRATLTKMSCASARSCFAVGYRTAVTGPVYRAISEHWNGTQWSYVRPRRPQRLSQLLGVSCPGPRNCWAAGWTGPHQAVSHRALIEHWNGTRWSTRPLPGTRNSDLRSVACPARARCTAAGVVTGFNRQRMLVADLSGGRWRASVLSNRVVNPGNLGLDDVSCRAPRVCSAVTRYISVRGFLTWAIASRGRAGGFRFQIMPITAAFDDPRDLSCSAHGCTLVGGKRSNDGRGDQFDIGTTLVWRGTGTSFAPQKTPPPPATAGGS